MRQTEAADGVVDAMVDTVEDAIRIASRRVDGVDARIPCSNCSSFAERYGLGSLRGEWEQNNK